MNLNDALIAIKQLPFNEFQNVLSDNDDVGTCIKAIKYQYKQHGKWLDFYFSDNQKLWIDLVKGDVGNYKPLGERTFNIYNHLKEIKLLSTVFQTSIDINDFLYLIEREIFYQTLNKIGFYKKGIIEGKRKIYENTKKLCQKFENIEQIKILGNTHTYSPSQLMMNESISIAQIPENYQFRELHRKFLKQIARCDRLMCKSSLQVAYLKKGKLIFGGDGKRAGK